VTIYRPAINGVSLSANPVNINTSFTISVDVIDAEVVMYAISKITGTFVAGQSVNLKTTKEVAS